MSERWRGARLRWQGSLLPRQPGRPLRGAASCRAQPAGCLRCRGATQRGCVRRGADDDAGLRVTVAAIDEILRVGDCALRHGNHYRIIGTSAARGVEQQRAGGFNDDFRLFSPDPRRRLSCDFVIGQATPRGAIDPRARRGGIRSHSKFAGLHYAAARLSVRWSERAAEFHCDRWGDERDSHRTTPLTVRRISATANQ